MKSSATAPGQNGSSGAVSGSVTGTVASAAPARRLTLAGLIAQVRTLQRRFDRRAQRERLLLIGAAAALALLAADALWLGPALADFKAARSQQQAALATRATLQADAQTLLTQGSAQTRQQQAELDSWRQRVRTGDAALRRHEDALVGPEQMVDLLSHLLARSGPVRVRALRSLGRSDVLQAGPGSAPDAKAGAANATPAGNPDTAPATVAAASTSNTAAANAAANPPTLYRHGVELVLEGGFNDLLAYLLAAEALPQRMLWGSVSLKVEQHPRSVLTLRVYTLSRDRHWLEI